MLVLGPNRNRSFSSGRRDLLNHGGALLYGNLQATADSSGPEISDGFAVGDPSWGCPGEQYFLPFAGST